MYKFAESFCPSAPSLAGGVSTRSGRVPTQNANAFCVGPEGGQGVRAVFRTFIAAAALRRVSGKNPTTTSATWAMNPAPTHGGGNCSARVAAKELLLVKPRNPRLQHRGTGGKRGGVRPFFRAVAFAVLAWHEQHHHRCNLREEGAVMSGAAG